MRVITKRNATFLLVVAAAFIGAALFVKLPVPTKDCSKTPTADCLSKAIEDFNYTVLEPEARKANAAALIEAGHYQKGLDLLAISDSSIAFLDAIDAAAQQVAEEALKHPETAASFDILSALKDPQTPFGKIVQNGKARTGIEQFFYSKLSFYLTRDANSGGGDLEYVRYNEKMAAQRFQPNATWNKLIQQWKLYAEALPERQRNSSLLQIAAQLRRIGNNSEAYDLLRTIRHNDVDTLNARQAVRELYELGKDEEAAYLRRNTFPAYLDRTDAAEKAIKAKQFEEAISLLQDATQALMNDSSVKGQDEEAALLRISKLYYDAGDRSNALAAAKQAQKVEKIIRIESPDKLSAHYRVIGYPDKAKAVLEPFIDPKTDSCSPFKNLDALAIEFYHLGMIDVAAQKISAFCDRVTVFGSMFGFKSAPVDKKRQQIYTWSQIYRDAVITGKDTNKIVEYGGEDAVEMSLPYLASYYLFNGDKKRGEEYLEKAIQSADYARGGACNVAYLANSVNRTDLIEYHFKHGLESISSDLRGLPRQTAYVWLAACHNQIRISRL